ncbi:MAG: methionine biosynthesis protein MetW [Victivallaceae bacterium]
MTEIYHEFLNERPDLRIISDLIEPNTRVLDLGCSSGLFLRMLKEQKKIEALGIEIDQDMIMECIANGVSVVQENLNRELTFAEDQSFDYVILSRTIQEVLHPDQLLSEIVRVGNKALVAFINFAEWKNRFQLFFRGHMPKSGSLPYTWYETPNIHLATIKDMRNLCKQLDIEIIQEIAIARKYRLVIDMFPNLLAHSCVFELRRRQK